MRRADSAKRSGEFALHSVARRLTCGGKQRERYPEKIDSDHPNGALNVMPGFLPGIHALASKKDLDGRDKPGQDADGYTPSG